MTVLIQSIPARGRVMITYGAPSINQMLFVNKQQFLCTCLFLLLFSYYKSIFTTWNHSWLKEKSLYFVMQILSRWQRIMLFARWHCFPVKNSESEVNLYRTIWHENQVLRIVHRNSSCYISAITIVLKGTYHHRKHIQRIPSHVFFFFLYIDLMGT